MPDELLTDWANLPVGLQPISLWDSVHDANLRAVRSDLLARTVTIEFAPLHLLLFHKSAENLTFTFILEGVQSVRALRYSVWPGRFTMPPGLSWEEQQQLTKENRSKWREASESWETFERAVAADEEAELTNGDLLRGPSGAVGLRLGVQMGGGEWYDAFLRAQDLKIRRSDGHAFDLEQFLELGNAYWEAFEKRQEDADE